jgi:hypothetical protein
VIQDTLRLTMNDGYLPIIFRKLKYDSTVNLNKIQFSTFDCYWQCPVYDLQIDSNGMLIFNGIKNIGRIGTFFSTKHKVNFIKIQDIIRRSYIDENKNRINRNCSDIPDYVLTIFYNNIIKSITFNMCSIDPEFYPLYGELMNDQYLNSITKIDTTINFISRSYIK